MPRAATYIYNLNFFAGFVVAAGVYWVLCKLSPVAATSERWMEVGDEIRDVSVAYAAHGRGTGFREEVDSQMEEGGSGRSDSSLDGGSGIGRFDMKGAKVEEDQQGGVRERKVNDF